MLLQAVNFTGYKFLLLGHAAQPIARLTEAFGPGFDPGLTRLLMQGYCLIRRTLSFDTAVANELLPVTSCKEFIVSSLTFHFPLWSPTISSELSDIRCYGLWPLMTALKFITIPKKLLVGGDNNWQFIYKIIIILG